jgi:glycosyltransferase involved in cell wall biosynthesis
MPSRKWFTCTPVRFTGDHTFFARDSGLLCKGFQEIGIECKSIMPGPSMEGDQEEDLIRVGYKDLENSAWWKSLGGEGVVFYGWGLGKYVKIVRAVKQSGLHVVSNLDTDGIIGILNGIPEYAGRLWRTTLGERGLTLGSLLYFVTRLGYDATVGFIRNDWTRARHLQQAHLIGAISPIAQERIRKACRISGGEGLAARVQLVPHPNGSYMVHDPQTAKERLVVAVGRWDDVRVKGTDLLLAVAELLLQNDTQVCFEIYGRVSAGMYVWHQDLPAAIRYRTILAGVVRNTEACVALQRAQVVLCTSLRESYHMVSAEALCCGCSVVGPDVPEIPSMKWFTDGPFGRMAARTPTGLAQAVLAELADWDAGLRDPVAIADHWNAILHAPHIARRILDMIDQTQRNSQSDLS